MDKLFRLNLTPHLAETRTIYQTGKYYTISWHEICQLFIQYFLSNFSNEKDTYGFNFGQFKKLTYRDWRLKIYNTYLDLDIKLSQGNISQEKRNKLEFKWDKINTEVKRQYELSCMFTDGYTENTFHRLAEECLTKSAIILDYDNNYSQNAPKLHYNEILNKYQQIGCNFIMYTSFSSTPDHEKFRVILPLSEPFKYVDLPIIREALINYLSIYPDRKDFIYGLIDYTSFEFPRMFYMPINKIEKYNKEFLIQTETACIMPECRIDICENKDFLDTRYLITYRNKMKTSLSFMTNDKLLELRKKATK